MQDIRKAIDKYLSVMQQSHPGQPAWEGFRCVLFDMDGVLYDSMPHHAVAWQRSMAEFGITMTAADAYATEGARGIDTIRHFFLKQKNQDISLEQAQRIYDEKTRIFHSMGEARVFPGVRELMRAIVQSGMQVGVVTGSGQRPLIDKLLVDFGDFLERQHITSAYDVQRGKPYPDPYLQGLHKAGYNDPRLAVVVENAPLGVRAGKAAHMFTVAVNSGPLPDNALLDEGADLLYPSINDLLNDWTNCTTARTTL